MPLLSVVNDAVCMWMGATEARMRVSLATECMSFALIQTALGSKLISSLDPHTLEMGGRPFWMRYDVFTSHSFHF